MTQALLRLLDLFAGLFRALNVDYPKLRAIVEVKLRMDNRRNSGGLRQYQKAGKETNNRFLLTLGLYAFFGLLTSILVWVTPSVQVAMLVVFSYVVLMTALTLISDFSEVLLDTTDNAVLLPRPVDGRTIFVARLVHIVLYVLLIVFALTLFSALAVAVRYGGLALLLFLGLTVQAALVSVSITMLLYLLIIRFTSEERLKDLISYVQIGMSLLFTVGYQIIPRVVDFSDLGTGPASVQPWHYAAPPAWLAGVMEAAVNRHFEPGYQLLTALALGVPGLLLWVNVRYLAPAFNQKMAGLGTASSGGGTEKRTEESRGRSWVTRLSDALTRSPLERAFFELTWKVTARDRRFKLRTYPSFGIFIPMLFIFFRNGGLTGFSEGSKYLILIYTLVLLPGTFYYQTFYSDDFKAAWPCYVTPMGSPRDVLVGTIKAVLLRFFTPFYLLASLVLVVLAGPRVLDDLLAGYLYAIVVMLMESVFKRNFHLPFSQEPKDQSQGGQTAFNLIMLIVVLPAGGLAHWGLTYLSFGVAGWCLALSGLIYLLLKRYEGLDWRQFA
jgi:hypothetical protein